MTDHGSTLRNLVGDKYLYSWTPGPRGPRRYVFIDATVVGYHKALRHAEQIFHTSRKEASDD